VVVLKVISIVGKTLQQILKLAVEICLEQLEVEA
jgi:hypothetical protein